MPAVLTFGPGRLTIGAAGSEVDYSCSVNGLRIVSAVDTADPTYKLCGNSVPGTSTISAQMTGNVDISGDADSLFQLCSENAGSVQSFAFLPHGIRDAGTGAITVGANDLEARGQLVVVPLDFGADAYADVLTSDVTFDLTGAQIDYYRSSTLAWSQPLGPVAATTGVLTATATADADAA
jgi:hypothetical protein